MDKILIAAIDCVAAIGVTPEERTMKQRLSIDVEIATDIVRAAQTDSLKDALDYSRVASRVMEICRKKEPPFLDQGSGHFAACHLYPERNRENLKP